MASSGGGVSGSESSSSGEQQEKCVEIENADLNFQFDFSKEGGEQAVLTKAGERLYSPVLGGDGCVALDDLLKSRRNFLLS